MKMSYGRAHEILESVKDLDGGALDAKLEELELTREDLDQAMSVVKKADVFLTDTALIKGIDFKNPEDLDKLSIEELAAVEALASENESANAETLEHIRKLLQNKVRGSLASGMSTKALLASDYLLESGVITGEKSSDYIRENMSGYDEINGLDGDVDSLEEIFGLLHDASKGKKSSKIQNIVTKETREKVNSYFKNVKYYDTVVDENGNEKVDEKGNLIREEVKNQNLIASYNTAIVDASLLDACRAVVAERDTLLAGCESREEKVAKVKTAINEALGDIVQGKVANIAVATAAEEEMEKTASDAGTKEKKHAKDLTDSVEAAVADVPNRLNVSAVIAETAKSVSDAEDFARRAAVKMRDTKAAKWLSREVEEVSDGLKSLWKNRYEIAKSIGDNRWGMVGRLAMTLGTAYVASHAAVPLAVGASIVYGAHAVAGNYVYPIIAKTIEIKRKAKEKGEKAPSFKERWKMAREELKNDKKYLRKGK